VALGLLIAPFTPFPAHSQVPTEYFISNDAAGRYVPTWNWSVAHTVVSASTVYVNSGTEASFDFAVTVAPSPAPMAKQVRVIGNILLENFGNPAAIVDLTDRLVPPFTGVCSVQDLFGTPATGIVISAFYFDFYTYSCELPDGPPPADIGVNETQAHFAILGEDREINQSVFAPFGWTPMGEADGCVKVEDSLADGLEVTATSAALPDGELCIGESGSFLYTARVEAVPGCVEFANRVVIEGVDSQTIHEAVAKVRVCGKTGAVGLGYWQNKNGQAQVAKAGVEADGSTCRLHPFLSGFAPFQDLSSSKSCRDLATWVAAVIRATNGRDSTLTGALKAQMLATALNMFFGGTALGELDVDLRAICNQSACVSPTDPLPNGFTDAKPAFGGADHMKVRDLLAYAASQYLPGAEGASWYGNVKAIQALARDTFAAINGEKAFVWRP